jgi:hypothetical protein
VLKSHKLYIIHAGVALYLSVGEELEGGICVEASEGTNCKAQEVKGRLKQVV